MLGRYTTGPLMHHARLRPAEAGSRRWSIGDEKGTERSLTPISLGYQDSNLD